MTTTKSVWNRLAVLSALCASMAATAEAATHQVQVLYVIPHGQTAKPRAEEAIAAIMAIVQRHYLQQLGLTFELKSPLVTQVSISQDANHAGDWKNNEELIFERLTPDYLYNSNVVVSIVEGAIAPAGGSGNIVKMTSLFWDHMYNTWLNKPHLLPQQVTSMSHELGHAFGLMHTTDTKPCMERRGVDMGALPSLVMEKTDDLGSVYNYPFHEVEKRLLLDQLYYPECRPFLYGRPHATAHLRLQHPQPYPAANGRNANVVEFGTRDGQRLGQFAQLGTGTWVEQNAQGWPVFSFKEENRDDWSIYLHDASRDVRIQLDLHTRKVMYGPGHSTKWELYSIVNASAKMNGRNASRVYYTNNWKGDEAGAFVQLASGAWVEQSLPDKQDRFQFREAGRDDWSVYLHDASRNIYIQLDLHTMNVNLMTDNGNLVRLYGVLLAQ